MIPSKDSNPFNRFSRTLPLLRAGTLEARLARTEEEIQEAQAGDIVAITGIDKMRISDTVFYEECGAQADETMALLKRDVARIDDYCDVLLVIDHSQNKIVGTYRFMLREAAEKYGDYYTSTEFDIHKVVSFPGQIMELGRSCVEKSYRTKPTMQLLWKGIGACIQQNNVSLCFGCASFIGTDVNQYKQALSYLYHYHLAPPEIRAKALAIHYQDMNLIAKDKVD